MSAGEPAVLAAITAAKNADWGQVVANGGPPCFHLEGARFCLRAQRWDGHDSMHRYVPLHELLADSAIHADESERQDPEIKRCPSTRSGQREFVQCGLPDGHDGDHTVLIPTGAPWDPSR